MTGDRRTRNQGGAHLIDILHFETRTMADIDIDSSMVAGQGNARGRIR